MALLFFVLYQNFATSQINFRKANLSVTWMKGGNTIRTDGTYEIDKTIPSGRLLKIKKVQVPDESSSVEGEYKCKANLQGHSEVEGRVHLTVEAPPIFTKYGRLNSRKATEGSNAEFVCKTYSHRSWSKPVVWLKNGKPIVGKH